MKRLSREELIVLVERIHAAEGTQDEITRWVRVIEQHVPMTEVSDLIFWSNLTPAEVVDTALSHVPVALPPPAEPRS